MLWILCCLIHLITYDVKASECILPPVEDICVYGNDKSFIADGATFEFFAYNTTTRTNIYICEECWSSTVSSAYLYGCISSNTNNYYWLIGQDYKSCSSWSSCYVGNTLGPNYNFDINNCFDVNNWRAYNGSKWNDDIDMSLSICNAICYETDIYPQTNTKTSQSVEIKVDTSTAWNGDLYFDFTIYEQDCMNPQLSFEYELIDYDKTYENIQIYDNNDILIATCNGGQSCGTFDSCLIDYYIDNIIQINETYSIMIHQTADINNLCNDYILNSVLILTCIPNNIITTNQGGNGEGEKEGGGSGWVIIVVIVIVIVIIIGYYMYKMMQKKAQDKVVKEKQNKRNHEKEAKAIELQKLQLQKEAEAEERRKAAKERREKEEMEEKKEAENYTLHSSNLSVETCIYSDFGSSGINTEAMLKFSPPVEHISGIGRLSKNTSYKEWISEHISKSLISTERTFRLSNLESETNYVFQAKLRGINMEWKEVSFTTIKVTPSMVNKPQVQCTTAGIVKNGELSFLVWWDDEIPKHFDVEAQFSEHSTRNWENCGPSYTRCKQKEYKLSGLKNNTFYSFRARFVDSSEDKGEWKEVTANIN